MDAKNLNIIKAKFIGFYDTNSSLTNIEQSLFKFLFNEVCNDIQSKEIQNFHGWLRYYSGDTNTLEDIVKLATSYYNKVFQQKFEDITFEEKVLIINALALYSIEMDIDVMNDDPQIYSRIIQTFIEIVQHYKLLISGYLSLKGEILISNPDKCSFFNILSANEIPITLFKS